MQLRNDVVCRSEAHNRSGAASHDQQDADGLRHPGRVEIRKQLRNSDPEADE